MKDFLKKPFVVNFMQGLKDMKLALQEANLKLFAKQVCVVVLIFFAVKWAIGKFDGVISANNEQIASVEAQKRNEKEYMANKDRLVRVEPQFPSVEEKNNWLTGYLLTLYKDAKLVPQLEGKPREEASSNVYVLMSQNVTTEMGYDDLGKFLEKVENLPDYIRVSGVSLSKDTSSQNIGNNKVSISFNTIFPKQKIGPVLFKNFDELVKKNREKQAAAGGGK